MRLLVESAKMGINVYPRARGMSSRYGNASSILTLTILFPGHPVDQQSLCAQILWRMPVGRESCFQPCHWNIHSRRCCSLFGILKEHEGYLAPGPGKIDCQMHGGQDFFCTNARGCPGGMVRVEIDRDNMSHRHCLYMFPNFRKMQSVNCQLITCWSKINKSSYPLMFDHGSLSLQF